MKPIDIKPSTYIDFNVENNQNPRSKVSDHVRISKYKSIFAKVYTPTWSENVFVIKKVINAVLWTNVLKVKKFLGLFMKKMASIENKQNLEPKK